MCRPGAHTGRNHQNNHHVGDVAYNGLYAMQRQAENGPEAGRERNEERMKTISRNLLLAVAAGALTERLPSINLGR